VAENVSEAEGERELEDVTDRLPEGVLEPVKVADAEGDVDIVMESVGDGVGEDE
jgi:hypothetical protein